MIGIEPTALITVTNAGPYPLRCGEFLLQPGVPVEVPFSFLNSWGGNTAIVPDFSAYADHLRSRTDDDRPFFDFWAPLSAVDGYGRHAIDVWRGLSALGVQATFRSVGHEDDLYLDKEFMFWARENRRLAPARVSVCFSVPYDAHHHTTGSVTNIALTQFETDSVPPRHVQNINRADHLIVTSSFQPEVWKRSGLKIPISVMTPGVDTDLFSLKDRPRGQYFRCLIVGALSGRKNGAAAVRIFQQASQGDPGWRLTIKNRALKLDRELLQMIQGDGRIELIQQSAALEDIISLYHSHDCLLWPSKGEGVGLPPMEAMSTGMEVVLTNSTGMKDYTDKRHCWPIRVRGMEDAALDGTWPPEFIRDFGGVGQYWMPDEQDGVKQLQQAFQAWYDGKGKGPAAAAYMRAHHTLQHQAESVLRVVEEYL